MHDYCIIGAGPAGLALAHWLAEAGRSVIVLEQHDQVGGCHRVIRKDGLFAEHSPRVYSTAYVNTVALLAELGLRWHDLFVPYNFSIATIGGRGAVASLGARELAWLALAFFACDPQQSVLEFARAHAFSDAAVDYLDRLCLLTDGAGADRYSLRQLLQLVNQQAFYPLYQPRAATDSLLFPAWRRALEREGVVIRTGVRVTGVRAQGAGAHVAFQDGGVRARAVVAAIPPTSLRALVPPDALAVPDFDAWAVATDYAQYVPVALHFDAPLPERVRGTYGFPQSDWAIAFVVVSNYFQEPPSAGVISAVVTRPDVASPASGKSANQSSAEEVVAEVVRELRSAIGMPAPATAFLTPGVYHDGQRWVNPNGAYVAAARTPPLPARTALPWLWCLGTHNGHSPYEFTSMESAVANARALANCLLDQRAPVLAGWTVKQALVAGLVALLLLLCVWTRSAL